MLVEKQIVGSSVERLEDDALVRGRGRFLDDLQAPGTLAAVFVRSPYAHARLRSLDTSAAQAMPGVVAIYTLADLLPHLHEQTLKVGMPSNAYKFQKDRPVLADKELAYVGEPIAVVIATTRYIAEDAAEQIFMDIEDLPVAADCDQVFDAQAALAHSDTPNNLIAAFDFKYGDIEAQFGAAAHVFREHFQAHRGGSHSIEGRGVLASYDPLNGASHVWCSTQTPHAAKRLLCSILGLPSNKVRVSAPDIGGAFGPKLVFYQEEAVITLASRLLKQAVKWVEDRREHFIATAHERDQHWDVEIAVDQDARILGIRGAFVHDYGAYTARGVNVPYGSGTAVTLPYNVPAYQMDVYVALTNKVPVSSIRGAGQPQGVFVMERLLDRVARELDLDRAEVRRRNLLRPEQFPYKKPLKLRGGRNVILDSGDYPATMEQALKESGWYDFPARQQEALKQGRYIGMGLANYVEATGRGPFEGVKIRIDYHGQIYVSSGAVAMGQSTKTMLAQIVAQQLGGDIKRIHVHVGDTDAIALGIGGFNSRQTVMAGSSAHAAAKQMRARILHVAAAMLATEPDKLDLQGGAIVARASGAELSNIEAVAQAVEGLAGYDLPGGDGPGLEVTAQIVMDDMAFSNGTTIVEVEVDIHLGAVKVKNFWLVHDCGNVINPRLVDGQVMGGVAHGLGNALFEYMGFDSQAQPITTTFADYLLVTAAEVAPVNIYHRHSPSPLNELGVKGVGESGVLPTPAAIAGAVDDALRSLNVPPVAAFPLTPARLYALLQRAGTGTSNPAKPAWRSAAEALLASAR